MEKLIAKGGTIGAYLLTFFSQDGISTFFAIILTIVMTIYYGNKAYHERVIFKKNQKDNDKNGLSK